MNDFFSRREFLGALGAGSLLPAVAGGQTFPASSVPVASGELWTWMRAQLVLDPDLAWFDTAGFGPTLRAVMSREFRSRERQSLDQAAYESFVRSPEAVRRQLTAIGAFLGAAADDLAFTSGATEGLNVVAAGLDLQPGDEVLTTTHDRPSAVYPWLLAAKRRGINVTQLPQGGIPASPEEIVARFAGAITPRTRVMAFAHVQASDGTLMPVRELCTLARAGGIFTVVDGAQGPGLIDLDLTALGCDAYAAAFHRWLNAARGTGVLYVRAEARARLWPLAVEDAAGWDTRDRDGAVLAADASAGMPATQAKYGCLSRHQGPSLEGIGISIELQQAVSRARIGARIRELAAYLRSSLREIEGVQVLSPSHPSLSTGIVAIRMANRDHAAVTQSMARDDRMAVGHVALGPAFDAIRVSLHACNTHDEVERLVNALRRRL